MVLAPPHRPADKACLGEALMIAEAIGRENEMSLELDARIAEVLPLANEQERAVARSGLAM